MTNTELLNFINVSIKNVNECVIPRENFCPVCRGEMKVISQLIPIFIDNQNKAQEKIEKANRATTVNSYIKGGR